MAKTARLSLVRAFASKTLSNLFGLVGASDDAQLAYAVAEGRVLITRDSDFLAMAADESRHAGIAYWTEKKHFGQLIKDLDALGLDRKAEDVQGQVFYLHLKLTPNSRCIVTQGLHGRGHLAKSV